MYLITISNIKGTTDINLDSVGTEYARYLEGCSECTVHQGTSKKMPKYGHADQPSSCTVTVQCGQLRNLFQPTQQQ